MLIQKNSSLKPYNTFGIDVNAAFFCEVFSVEELIKLLQDDTFRQKQKLILGGGSNVLFTKDVEALVIHNQIKGIEIISEDAQQVIIKAGAGDRKSVV